MKIKDQAFSFEGKKLRTARIARGLTLEELATELGLSHQAVSKYENDKANPDPETLREIADILKFNPSFFYSNGSDILDPQSTHFFRSGAAVAKKYKEQVKEKVRLLAILIAYIESKMKLPPFHLPSFVPLNKEFRQIDFEEIDDLAQKMRRYVGLGDGPISNITAFCERLGIVVAYAEMDNEKIDACTVWYNGRPYILLNEERISSVRLRFNIAHELAHILLHSNYEEKEVNDRSKHKRIEQEANRLASAFLMPESTISQELSASGLDYLLILKEHWKVSVQAIIYRAEELGIFTTDYALYLRQQISRKKWRTKEPLDDTIQIEKPKLFPQAIRLLVEKYSVSLDEISFHTGIVISELCKLGEIECEEEEIENSVPRQKVIQFPKKEFKKVH